MAGMPLPPAMIEAPELFPTLQLFWDCYFTLRRGLDRQQTISWERVQAWCAAYGVDDEIAFAAQRYVVVLDEVWIELHPPPKPPPQPGT